MSEETRWQLSDNLVSNALKFTSRGGRVTLGGYVESGELRIAIADNGPGIPPEHRARLWVDSAVGNGSTFQFTLPLIEELSAN